MQINDSALWTTTRRYDKNLQNSIWKINPLVAPTMNEGCLYLTSGNDERLHKSHAKYDLRKDWFANRAVNM